MPAINRYYSSVATDTTLSSSITSTALTLTVGSTAGFPTSYPYTLAIGYDLSNEELVTIVSASGTTLTVGTTVAGGANIAGRGVDGTNDQAHNAGEAVKHVISARDMTESQAHIAAESGAHGITGSFVGTTDTQALTNKTITGGTVNPTTLQQGGVPVATTTGTQILTGKTVDLTSNTLTGTIAQFNTAVSNADLATLTGTEALTNKTLTSPTINAATLTGDVTNSSTITGGTLSGTTLSGTTLSGTTTATSGTIALGTNVSAITANSLTVTATQVGYLNGVTSAIQTQLNTNTPVGSITMWATATPPTGWLLCNGQSTASYTALAAVVGATVPDMQGFVPAGFKTSDDAFGTLKGTGGSKTSTAAHTHDINHNHAAFTTTGGEGSHTHQSNIEIASSLTNGTIYLAEVNTTPRADYLQYAGAHNHSIDVPALGVTASGASSVSATNGNLQPYFTLNFIIKF